MKHCVLMSDALLVPDSVSFSVAFTYSAGTKARLPLGEKDTPASPLPTIGMKPTCVPVVRPSRCLSSAMIPMLPLSDVGVSLPHSLAINAYLPSGVGCPEGAGVGDRAAIALVDERRLRRAGQRVADVHRRHAALVNCNDQVRLVRLDAHAFRPAADLQHDHAHLLVRVVDLPEDQHFGDPDELMAEYQDITRQLQVAQQALKAELLAALKATSGEAE